MLGSVFRWADAISSALSRLSEAVALLLVASMIYEVVARYIFGAPTLWAFDLSYMSTGVLFILGAGQALRDGAHIRIDFLSSRFPARIRNLIDGIAFVFLLTPLLGALAWVGVRRAWTAFVTGEVETVSPWAPLMWPFYSLLALGLVALALQIAVEGIRALAGRDIAVYSEKA